MYPLSLSGQIPGVNNPAPKPMSYYSGERYCEACDVKWSAKDPDQMCWSCGGQTEETE